MSNAEKAPGISSLAVQAIAAKKAKERSQPIYGLVVHTTGSGLPSKARDRAIAAVDYGVRYYQNSLGTHYVIGWGGLDGDLRQVMNERRRARGVGFGKQLRHIRDGTWKSSLPRTLVQRWQQAWPDYEDPGQLFPSTSVNNVYVHAECIPMRFWHRDKLVTGAGVTAMADGLRFTRAQHDAVVALAIDIAGRHGWPDGWWRSPRLLGHEDVSPITRHDKGGGWDPGWLRARPYFDFAYVRDQIATKLSKKATKPRRDAGREIGRGQRSSAVRALQRDLAELGFTLVGQADGHFGGKTEVAVREFQIYAGFANVAREKSGLAGRKPARYVDRLERAKNGKPYRGDITGVADRATVEAVAYWKDRKLRCPVVIEAWLVSRKSGARTKLVGQNLWLASDLRDAQPRVFARDFSGYYGQNLGPDGDPDRDPLITIGEYYPKRGYGGPRSLPPKHTWPQCEVTPRSLFGASLGSILGDRAKTATFKVVRAISEAECRGYLDSINCWDNVYASLGPYHWALGASSWREGGELGGFFSYARQAYPQAFDRAIGRFGLRADKDWGSDGGDLFLARGSRRYVSRLALQRSGGDYTTIPMRAADMEYLRSWHWFYRYIMATRTIPEFRQAMWDMARLRIRDVLATPWGQGLYVASKDRPATIGDIATSERAIAMIVRWHIRYPNHMINRGQAADTLRQVLADSHTLARGNDVGTWRSDARLVRALARSPKAPDTLRDVRDWPSWGSNPRAYQLDSKKLGPLDLAHNSFELFGD